MINEKLYQDFILKQENDSAHDLAHVQRVVKNAETILLDEQADAEIVIASAWLHDCVVLPKNHPDRKSASNLAAIKAVKFLKEISFPAGKLEQVEHAIKAHSYSAGIKPKTTEAEIVQDADRLDALGAIGIARCFMVGGDLNRPVYNPDDPFCIKRDPDELNWTLDHFYQKLFLLPETLNTASAKKEANTRVEYMKLFIEQLKNEISAD